MLPPLEMPAVAEPARHHANYMPSAGFPAFEFDFIGAAGGEKRRVHGSAGVPSSLPDLHSEGPSGMYRDQGRLGGIKHESEGTRARPGRDPSLSAQGAAEVLYGINKSESGTNVDTGGRMPYPQPTFLVPMQMMNSDGTPALHLPPSGMHSEGSQGCSSPIPQLPSPPPLNPHLCVDGDAARGMPMAHTAQGIPVEAMGAGMPMMIPWNSEVMGGMPQMMMTPQGMISVMSDQGPCLLPMPIKGEDGDDMGMPMTIQMGGMPMQMMGDMLVPLGQPVCSGPDGKVGSGPMFMAGGIQLPEGMMPFQGLQMVPMGRVGEGPEGMVCSMAAVSMPDSGQHNGISEEDFRNAMRMAQVPEMSATS